MIKLHFVSFKGHLLLHSLRDSIINQSQKANPNWDIVRDLIGQYLFTLQEFYSNTNWVEMFGSRVCQELGIFGHCSDIEDHLSSTTIFFNKRYLAPSFCQKYLVINVKQIVSLQAFLATLYLSKCLQICKYLILLIYRCCIVTSLPYVYEACETRIC